METKSIKHSCKVTCLAALSLLSAGTACMAHVKWFCAYDVAGQPVGLENVLCPDFEELVGLSLLFLLMGATIERTSVGAALLRATEGVARLVRPHADVILRATVAFLLVSLFDIGGTLLTPELKTTSTVVPWAQLVMAACLMWRRTLVVTAAGIVALYGVAIADYGVFHMMDYPIFIGAAAYLAMSGLSIAPRRFDGVDVLRWTSAVTLMWASVEKWAYPEWTAPLLAAHPDMPFGVTGDFFMRAAGAVEFALAFSLLLGPLCRRVGAVALLGIFLAAIPGFGKIDAVGHAVIIGVLIAVAVEPVRAGVVARRPLVPSPGGLRLDVAGAYAASLVATLAVYYLSHAALYATTVL